VARASREGAACLIDAPLFIIRLLLWIKWQVPVTALFMKNVLGILVFRSLGDYIQFVNPVVTGSRRGSTASRMEEGKEMQPALYGVKAKELNAKVQMRERQLKEHREALIRYKAELDHMVEEVQKRDRMLEMKQNMYLVGGEIDEFRDSLHQGMQKTDRSGSLDAASPSSQAFSVNQPLYSVAGQDTADAGIPPPASGLQIRQHSLQVNETPTFSQAAQSPQQHTQAVP